jgi:hypothetical protein
LAERILSASLGVVSTVDVDSSGSTRWVRRPVTHRLPT